MQIGAKIDTDFSHVKLPLSLESYRELYVCQDTIYSDSVLY